MIRPFGAAFNKETAESNAFQKKAKFDKKAIKKKVRKEFNSFVESLQSNGIKTFVFDDTKFPKKPDAVFPNNWITFHPDGTVVLYPMEAQSRRLERRMDIIDELRSNFEVSKIIDLSGYEVSGKFLEGTGSIVFDHRAKIAYACSSPRTDEGLLIRLCERLGYQPMYFDASDKNGKAIYHTNVMMNIGEHHVIACMDSIKDLKQRKKLTQLFKASKRTLINIDFKQMGRFAGNMLEVRGAKGKNFLVLSKKSFKVLTDAQKKKIEKKCKLLPMNIKTIETIGGGSVRCMMAEIFLPKRKIQQ